MKLNYEFKHQDGAIISLDNMFTNEYDAWDWLKRQKVTTIEWTIKLK